MPPVWSMSGNKSYLECLVLTQSFETFWAYYSLSSGTLFGKECRETGAALCECFVALAKTDETFLHRVRTETSGHAEEYVKVLSAWSSGDKQWPGDGSDSWRRLILSFLVVLKTLCLNATGSSVTPTFLVSGEERSHSRDALLWKGHLPGAALSRAMLTGDVDPLIQEVSSTTSIVLVGDIRRSQDLMTYATDDDAYSESLLHFVEGTRELVEKHGGIFDKFTGDGFIAYFNDAVCRSMEMDFVSSFMAFIVDESRFARELFAEWIKTIRKIPPAGVGLAMGADFGRVSLKHMRGHLIAVGDSIVWATRMAAEAGVNETLLNNALYYRVKDFKQSWFTDRSCKTKTGEEFLARVMSVKL